MKKQQNGIIAQKCSFKDSFVDSDSFMNVEERDTQDNLNTPNVDASQHVKQKSMGDLIKERYLAPMMIKA